MKSGSFDCTFSDDSGAGTFTVSATVTDDDTGAGSDTKQVDVDNVAPGVTLTSPNLSTPPQAKGTPSVVTVSFTDAGTADTHTCSITWDDGTTTSGIVSETNGSGTCTASKTYAAPGRLHDHCPRDGRRRRLRRKERPCSSCTTPSAGFVTGGGWIDVNPGSFPQIRPLTGKGNFGFTSQYKKGATIPTGKTEFQFQAGEAELPQHLVRLAGRVGLQGAVHRHR